MLGLRDLQAQVWTVLHGARAALFPLSV
jgi:hypothetical protein